MQITTVSEAPSVAVFVDPSISANAAVYHDGTWYKFGFLDDQNFVKECKQVDSLGFVSCTPSDGTPTPSSHQFLHEFDCHSSDCWLTVTDAFPHGDIFEVFDNNRSIGETTAVASDVNNTCGSDQEVYLSGPLSSSKIFDLGP